MCFEYVLYLNMLKYEMFCLFVFGEKNNKIYFKNGMYLVKWFSGIVIVVFINFILYF